MALRQMMVVAGEASGDRHAASLVIELTKRLPETRFFGMGGPLLEAAGLERIYAADEVSVMGITEVAPKLPRILKVMNGLTQTAARRLPQCAILVDIPDFNLRLAARLKRLGIKVIYFVSPMIWAWRKYRIHQIANWVDLMLCSRSAEVKRIFPWMIEATQQIALRRPDLQVVVPVAHSIRRSELDSGLADPALKPILLDGQAPEAVGASDIAVVASGTATLEAALMKRPLIAVYRMAPISYWLGRLLVRVPHVSLVNLIAQQRVIPELLQGKMAPKKLAVEIEQLWSSPADQERMIRSFDRVRERLGPRGAAARAAEEITSML